MCKDDAKRVIAKYRKTSPYNSSLIEGFLDFLYKEGDEVNINRFDEILDSIENDRVETIRRRQPPENRMSPILICVFKNELVRLQRFFQHYRNIGIKLFVMLDNNSSDGSREFCMEQDDADVFEVTHAFSSARHVAWVNKILEMYGRERWYLSVDADELLDYIESEHYDISAIVRYAHKNQFYRLPAIQVEFYAKDELFSRLGNDISWSETVYFDVDSYETQESKRGYWIVGGPRKRVLNTYSLLTKYALFYYDNNDVYISMHYLYPYSSNFGKPIFLVLKHYEFLNEEDLKKMNAIIKRQNYAANSKEYKEMYRVIDKERKVTFWSDKSAQYNDSSSLCKLPFLSVLSTVNG